MPSCGLIRFSALRPAYFLDRIGPIDTLSTRHIRAMLIGEEWNNSEIVAAYEKYQAEIFVI